MAFNIFERWPWTSFQNLNLDWLMTAVKEAGTKADEAAASVGQFDARITQNTNAIEELGIDLETISSTARVFVNSSLEAFYRGNHITGAELVAMVQQHGDLPYVEYNGEVYMLDTVSTAGDMRFSMAHITTLNDVIIRHIMIPAQSYNAAYSITNVGSGGGSSNVFTVTITDRGDYATPQYICDHTFAEIRSQIGAGNTPVFLINLAADSGIYNACGSVIATADYIDVFDPSGTTLGKWKIDSSNNISRYNAIANFATIDTVFDNAVIYSGPQTLTAAQQAQARENIGAVGAPYRIPITVSGGVYSTTATGTEVFENRANCYAEVNGVMFYPVGCNSSGPHGDLFLASAEPTASNIISNDVLKITMNGTAVAAVQHFTADVDALPVVTTSDNGKFLRVVSGAWAAAIVPDAESTEFGP